MNPSFYIIILAAILLVLFFISPRFYAWVGSLFTRQWDKNKIINEKEEEKEKKEQ